MLTTSELRSHLAHRFPDVEQVEECVLRFTRRFEDRPFAVYYVDNSSLLPSTPEAIGRYRSLSLKQTRSERSPASYRPPWPGSAKR